MISVMTQRAHPETDDEAARLKAIAPLLIGVQTNPERDVSLQALANEYGLSPTHFQRVFKETVGESPRAHVERLRLERAAYRLCVTRESILDIALDLGFESHETFSRAFKRRFGTSPSAMRKGAREGQRKRLESGTDHLREGCWLSDVSFLTLKPMMLLGIRRFGDYYDYSGLPAFGGTNTEFPSVLEFIERRKIPYRKLAITIPYDNPLVTPPHLQQADACLPILEDHPGEGDIRRIDLPGGLYAAVEHRGPFETFAKAYTAVAMGVQGSEHYTFRADPPLQFFREISPDGDPMKNLTEVYFPVEIIR